MSKRKRTANLSEAGVPTAAMPSKKIKSTSPTQRKGSKAPTTIQVITGSYDRVLHGITATLPQADDEQVEFADTFLFNAHTSAIRCLALSPPSAAVPKQTQKIILASGSTDERINLYHISAHPPTKITVPIIPSLTSKAVVEDSQNRELGSLLHHSSSITGLCFPTRSKLLSSAEDSTVAVTRTRDWSLLSTIKAPIPKAAGRPSGDTAPLGGAPSGVNDFAVHPSLKLMITVGKGEKSMRLWNLVTGKKAGVLNFSREMLMEAGEGRHSSGEGRKVAWGATDLGDEFCVGFDKGALVFGMDSKPKCKVVPEPRTKIHELSYIQVQEEDDIQVMAVSTEDGRVLFYSTRSDDLVTPASLEGKTDSLPSAKLIAQIGGKGSGTGGRVKDFAILKLDDSSKNILVVTGCSDGAVRIWMVSPSDLHHKEDNVTQVGRLVGLYETGNRITCLEAFVMIPRPEGAEDIVDEMKEAEDEEGADSSSSDSD